MKWPMVELGDIANLYQPKTITQAELIPHGEFDVFGANGIIGRYNKYNHRDSEVVLTCRGATCGTVNMTTSKSWITGNAMVVTPISQEYITKKYLFHVLNGTNMCLVITGAAQPQITRSNLKDLQIPLPPLDEQKRIAGILDKVDAIRRKRKESIKLADTFIKSVFLDMFGDPVTNPKGWKVRRLSEFYISPKEGTKCGPFGSALKKGEFVESGIPVWCMDNIDLMGRMLLPFRMWITPKKYKELSSYVVQDGDVIISRAGTVGKMCVAKLNNKPSIISTNLIRLRLGKELHPLYFVSLMTYCKGRVGRLKTGADDSFTYMNTTILDKLEFPYPPISIQNQFIEIIHQMETSKITLHKSLSETETLFKALQQEFFG